MNLRWFFRPKVQAYFWSGKVGTSLAAYWAFLQNPQWPSDLFGWVTDALLPSLSDWCHAAGHVLTHLFSH